MYKNKQKHVRMDENVKELTKTYESIRKTYKNGQNRKETDEDI